MSLGAGALEGLVEPGNISGRGKEVSIVTLQAATAQGTVTLIESVEYLPAPSTYPREGGEGKKSSAK